jgi:hypothetical protein
MQRFRCRTADEFEELLRDLPRRIDEAVAGLTEEERTAPFDPRWEQSHYNSLPGQVRRPQGDGFEFIPFDVLDAKFIQNASVLDPRKLPKPQRRVWAALRWAFERYAAEVRASVLGTVPLDSGRRRAWGRGMQRKVLLDYGQDMMLVLGRSNAMDGWTDGASYVAVNVRFVEEVSRRGVEALDEVWRVFDHELAHDGDSIEAGHDAAFFERHHDIAMRAAGLAGQYKALFARKWLLSYEGESKRKNGRTVAQENVMRRLERERRARGEDLRQWRRDERAVEGVPMTEAPEVPHEAIALLNEDLRSRGLNDLVPTLDEVRVAAAEWRAETAEQRAADAEARRLDDAEHDALYEAYAEADREHAENFLRDIAAVLGRDPEAVIDDYVAAFGITRDDLDIGHIELEFSGTQTYGEFIAEHDLLDVMRRLAAERGCALSALPIADAVEERNRKYSEVAQSVRAWEEAEYESLVAEDGFGAMERGPSTMRVVDDRPDEWLRERHDAEHKDAARRLVATMLEGGE